MANINENLLVKGARGNFGRQFVYRTEGDNTHIVKMPRVTKRDPNETEIAIREKFAAAARYGRSAAASPELGQAYKKKAGRGKRAFVVAFKDYITPPKVRNINTGKYDGTPGSLVVVNATDDFRVAEVRVSIHAADGALIEEGMAVQDTVNVNLWNYAASQSNDALTGSTIRALAVDVPGNEASLEVTL